MRWPGPARARHRGSGTTPGSTRSRPSKNRENSARVRGPVPLAKALSALDVLSDGRVIAGVGPGSSKADYDAVGVPFEQRWQRFDEAARLLKPLLQPGAAADSGAYGATPV